MGNHARLNPALSPRTPALNPQRGRPSFLAMPAPSSVAISSSKWAVLLGGGGSVRYVRIAEAFGAMRVTCMVHGE